MTEGGELTRAERRLSILLAILGFACLVKALCLWLPGKLLELLARPVGIPPGDLALLDSVPLWWYALRAGGVLYVGIGLMFLIASNDPLGHGAFVRVVTLCLALFAIVLPVSGAVLKLPIRLYATGGVGSLLLCLLLALLYRNAWRSVEATCEPAEPQADEP